MSTLAYWPRLWFGVGKPKDIGVQTRVEELKLLRMRDILDMPIMVRLKCQASCFGICFGIILDTTDNKRETLSWKREI